MNMMIMMMLLLIYELPSHPIPPNTMQQLPTLSVSWVWRFGFKLRAL